LRMLACGRLDSGDPVPAQVCRTFRGANWEIRDEFTPGHGGDNHIDLYVGEESEPNYTTSAALYVALADARFDLRT
jgi:transcriptional regulator of nitric oxide reductase